MSPKQWRALGLGLMASGLCGMFVASSLTPGQRVLVVIYALAWSYWGLVCD